MWVKPVVVGLISLLFVGAVSAQVVVEQGVRLQLVDGNTTLVMGQDYNFSRVDVFGRAAGFEGRNVSIINDGSSDVRAVLWTYRIGAENVGSESIRIGTNGTNGERIQFRVTGTLTDRDYRIEEDDALTGTVSSGSSGVIVWDSSTWLARHNFSAIPLEVLENITLTLKTRFNHPDTVVIDNTENPSPSVYTGGALDFGYGVVEAVDRLAGIVPGASLLQLRYENQSSYSLFAQTQDIDDSIFFLPFIRGTHDNIEQRERHIQGGLFGPGNFLGFPSPNFGFQLTEEKTVRVSITFDSLILQALRSGDLAQGTYTLIISNTGTDSGKPVVNIRQQ